MSVYTLTDWEMAEAYRSWRARYGEAGWEAKFRQKFERGMTTVYDTHFFVGTIHHWTTWVIVGLWYPPVGAYRAPVLQGSLGL